MRHCLRILLSAFLGLLLTDLHAQQNPPDSALAAAARARTVDNYQSFMGMQAPLYNGKTYLGHLPLKGNPYFLEDSMDIGTVNFDGILFTKVSMFYDIIDDNLVVVNAWGGMLAPVPEKISEFTISGHHFIRARGEIYDLLVSGKMSLLARRTKVVTENIVQLELIRNVSENDHYFAWQDGVYHHLGNLNALLDLMKDRKKEILQYLRQQKIRRHRDKERAMIAATQFYNQSLSR
jgi:hypothetical protein